MGAACGGKCGPDLILPRPEPGGPDHFALVRSVLGQSADDSDDEDLETEGQDHVYTFIDEVGPEGQAMLEEQMEGIDAGELEAALNAAFKRAEARRETKLQVPEELNFRLKKPPRLHQGANFTNMSMVPPKQLRLWRQAGIEQLAMGKVAVVFLAGGEEQKASGGGPMEAISAVNIGLPSGKSLLHILSERLLRLARICSRTEAGVAEQEARQRRQAKAVEEHAAGKGRGRGAKKKQQKPDSEDDLVLTTIPLYVMVNQDNEADIVGVFQKNDYFGLDPSSVFFFLQDNTPLLDRVGRIMLRTKSSIQLEPEGCGSFIRCLVREGALADMKTRGVTQVCVMATNNLLGKVADPVLIGYCHSRQTPTGLKIIERFNAEEPMGVFVNEEKETYKDADGDGNLDAVTSRRPLVVPFHALTHEQRNRRGPSSRVFYWTGDLCQYYFSVPFLQRSARLDAPYVRHLVEKKFSGLSLKTGKPRSAHAGFNSFKMVSYISDVFEKLESVQALFVDRWSEWARLRGPGDAPGALTALSLLHEGWLRAAGGIFVEKTTSGLGSDNRCEVSPLVSYEGEGLEGLFLGCGADAHGTEAPPAPCWSATVALTPGAASGLGVPTRVFEARKADVKHVQAIRLPLSLMAHDEEEILEMHHLTDQRPQKMRANFMYAPKVHEGNGYFLLGRSRPDHKLVVSTDVTATVDEAEGGEKLCKTPPWLKREETQWQKDMDRKFNMFVKQQKAEEEQRLQRQAKRRGDFSGSGSPSGSPRSGGGSPRPRGSPKGKSSPKA